MPQNAKNSLSYHLGDKRKQSRATESYFVYLNNLSSGLIMFKTVPAFRPREMGIILTCDAIYPDGLAGLAWPAGPARAASR